MAHCLPVNTARRSVIRSGAGARAAMLDHQGAGATAVATRDSPAREVEGTPQRAAPGPQGTSEAIMRLVSRRDG
jgi:hypothetical protein